MHGIEDTSSLVQAKVGSIRARMRERREFEDVLKEAAELTNSTEVLEQRAMRTGAGGDAGPAPIH